MQLTLFKSNKSTSLKYVGKYVCQNVLMKLNENWDAITAKVAVEVSMLNQGIFFVDDN